MLNRRSFVTGSLAAAASAASAQAAINPLTRVRTFMYALQRLEYPYFVDRLAATAYDMFVIEPGADFKGGPYPARQFIRKLRHKPDGARRIILVYVDVGQAEKFRTYWTKDWKAPTETEPGHPDFLVAPDPDGWTGDYGVAYWDPDWKKIWLGAEGLIAKLATLGFDGIYMDWVSAYEDPPIRKRAHNDGVNPNREMINFIAEMRSAGRAVNPGFLVVPQNATALIKTDPDRYTSVIDAFAVEDTWYRGEANAKWGDPDAGDLPSEVGGTVADRIRSYQPYVKRGLPVFTIDYCIKPDNAAKVYRQARNNGLVPLVTRVSLDHLTTTPPPWL